MRQPTDVDIPEFMRATVLVGHGGLDKLVYRSAVPVPVPRADEVLVRVGACGVNNTDVNTRTAWYDRDVDSGLSEQFGVQGRPDDLSDGRAAASWNTATVSFPRISGAAVVGRIVRTGDGVEANRIGQRVMVDPQIRDKALPERAQLVAYLGSERDGGFAQFVAIPASNAHVVESDLTDAELATFPCSYDTAEEMLVRTGLAAGETVVVTGASGGVGTALIQLAKVRGARVIAVASAVKDERVRAVGADAFLARDTEDLVSQVRALTGGLGAHVVADVVGGPSFGGLLRMLRRGGRYATAGAIAGPLETIDLRDLIYKDLEMHGVTCPAASTFARVVGLVSDGQVKPLLDGVFPLERLGDAQAALVKREHVGKLVVTP